MGNFRCVQHPFHYYSYHSILRTSPPLTWRVIRVISTITITARAPRPLGRRHRCCLAAHPFNDVYFFTFSANNAYDEDRSKRKLVRCDCVQCAWTRTENWFNVLSMYPNMTAIFKRPGKKLTFFRCPHPSNRNYARARGVALLLAVFIAEIRCNDSSFLTKAMVLGICILH